MSEENTNQEVQPQLDGLSAAEGGMQYIDKRDKGLPPGVQNANVQSHQQVDPQDPGLPRAGEDLNKRPDPVPSAEEKAKIAEAEAVAKANADAEAAKNAEAGETEEAKKHAEEDAANRQAELDEAAKSPYESYGDPAADAAIELLQKREIPAEESAAWFKKVAETGDINDLDYAAMEAKLGKADAQLVKSAVTDYFTRTQQSHQKTADAIKSTLGSAENFNKVRDWANRVGRSDKNMAAQLTELYSMFERGEHSARAAAKELKSLYEADANNKSLTISKVEGDRSPVVTGEAPMTRDQYLEKMKVAQNKGDHAEIARLRAARGAVHSAKRS